MNRRINRRMAHRGITKHSVRVPRSPQQGSAILLCFLAIAVLSVASISIVRSHRRLNIRRSVALSTVQGRFAAEGLMNRQIAFQRTVATGPAGVRQVAAMTQFAPIDEALTKLPGMANFEGQVISVDTTSETIDLEITFYNGAPPIRRRMLCYSVNRG